MPLTVPDSAPLTPVAPFDAYREDVDRLAGRAPVGVADDAWFVAAHVLTRAASMRVEDRPPLLAAGADAVHAVVTDLSTLRNGAEAENGLQAAAAAADALRTIGLLLSAHGNVPADQRQAARDRAIDALQQLVAEEEQAGAFRLAFTTIAALRTAAARLLDDRQRGHLLAQQGRVARQLGALDTARELYGEAVRAARRGQAPDAAARALLGLGVLASMYGNYPDSRRSFRRALSAARRAGSREMQRAAHQGLFVAAIAARDVEVALAHGWASVRRAPADAHGERAAALANLAEAGCLAGEHRAALGACLAALELTELARVRLPILGTAVRAAAAVGEHRLVAHLTRDLERTVERSGQPFENALAFVELSEALLTMDDSRGAVTYAERARDLADAGSFHEIRMRADEVIEAVSVGRRHEPWPASPCAGDAVVEVRSSRARAVLRSMETLPAARRYASRVAG